MCTLAVYFQINTDYPVVVAANRDEFYDRPATPPRALADDPWAFGGQDAAAGGTWLGVNGYNLVAGILNRRSAGPPDPARRSRGQLCLEVLRQATVAAAADGVARQPGARYNPFNLLLASPGAAVVVGNTTGGNASGTMRATTLQPGLHLLTNLELNDMECPRIAKSYGLFADAQRWARPAMLGRFLEGLRAILSDHSTPLDPRAASPPNNLCVHSERFGTRSSTVLVYEARAARFRMWHANGPPCVTAYTEVALPAPADAPATGPAST